MDEESTTVAEVLKSAAHLITVQGWVRFNHTDDDDGLTADVAICVAAHGMDRSVLHYDRHTDLCRQVIESFTGYLLLTEKTHMRGRGWSDDIVAGWNDDDIRTAAEVIASLEEAARLSEIALR